MKTQIQSPTAPGTLARALVRVCHWPALSLLAASAFVASPARAAVTEVWVQRYDGPVNSSDSARGVAIDGSGNVVVTGSSASGFDDGWPVYDYYTAKYAAADGALLWEKRYNGLGNWWSDDAALAVIVDSGGNVVVTGSSAYDYYTAKYAAADGALLWEQRYNSPASSFDMAIALAVDGSGNVVVTGLSFTCNSSGCSDYYTAKYAAADGALIWERRYNGPANNEDRPSAVAVDSSGNVVVTGSSGTLKYAAADGALLWEKHDGYAHAVAVDSSGNVVVTGSSGTFKYAAADGALLWESRINGGDGAQAVAVDGSGNVLVTGFSTAKYAAADGALLWEQLYDGPAYSFDSANALAVDGNGNVVVTGHSGQWPNSDYYTAKYAAADGALLWEKRYNGPANEEDSASSLALGPNGMVAITGSSDTRFGPVTAYDYATFVYRDTPPPVSFADWVACYGLTAAPAAADADPDSDGLPNGVEYILGGNPKVSSVSGSPTATINDGKTVLTFPRDDNSETPDVTLTVETGTDLMSWPWVFHIGPDTDASGLGVSVTENGSAPDTVTVTIPQIRSMHLFARLKVTIAP